MKKKTVVTVFGTRPEAIKMAPVAIALRNSDHFNGVVCITGQHREMLDQVLSVFGLVADFDLNIMLPGQDLYDITSKVLIGMRDVLRRAKPDLVLVHGDTTTCFAAALAAFYENIPIGHVEAGLRTYNLAAPFPEEANRTLVSHLASYHFAPTQTSMENLLREHIQEDRIWVTGNTVIDALQIAVQKASEYPDSHWEAVFGVELYQYLVGQSKKIVLITGHRRENFGKGVLEICEAIRCLSERHSDWILVYPVHLNPNIKDPVYGILGNCQNVWLIAPLDYLPFVWLMNKAKLILTDSGGIQEEGPSLGKPVLVMRDVTERPEALKAGTVILVGADCGRIIEGVERVMADEAVYNRMANATNPYGDGRAAQRILNAIAEAE